MDNKSFHEQFMRQAIALSCDNVKQGGGPFGAVIVCNGEVIATGVNRVTRDNDPTAHAEINAIRAACALRKTHWLMGCVLYTSCEPCPMCFGAIHWARLDRVYYANTRHDAAAINFDDAFIYEELTKEEHNRVIPVEQLLRNEAQQAFSLWQSHANKVEY